MSHSVDYKEFVTDDLIEKLFSQENTIILKNGKPQDVQVNDELMPTVLCAMYELSVAVDQMIKDQRSSQNEVFQRFNPLYFMGEILMRKNPKYAPNEKMALQFKDRVRKYKVKKLFKSHEKQVLLAYNKIKGDTNDITGEEVKHMAEVIKLLDSQFCQEGVFGKIDPNSVLEGNKEFFLKFEKFYNWFADQIKLQLYKELDIEKFPSLVTPQGKTKEIKE